MFIYFEGEREGSREREKGGGRERTSGGGAERGIERIPSRLHTPSTKPQVGINLTNREVMT